MAMVIQGIYNNNKYFLADIPDIDVRNCVGEVTVVVTIGSDTVTEVYSPDNNMVVKIQGLYELLCSYFSLPDFSVYSNEYIMDPKTVQFKFTDSSSSTTVSISVFFSKAELGYQPGDDYAFLSRYKSIKTAASRKEYISFHKIDQSRLQLGVAYISSGKAKYKLVDLSMRTSYDCLYSRLVSVNKVAQDAGVGASTILFYDLKLYVSDTLRDHVKYEVDNNIYPNETNFLYYNPFGLPESMSFLGYVDLTPSYDGDINVFQGYSKRQSSKVKDIKKVYSGFISEAKYNAVKDMLVSDMLYTYSNDTFREIVIDDVEMEHTVPTNEVKGVSVTYYPARVNHATFERSPNLKNRIFDKTFDHTFD